MKNLIIVLLIIGAIFCLMYYEKDQSQPAKTQKRTSSETANPSAAATEQDSAMDSTINYMTGSTQIKALQSTKDKLNNVQKIREKQINEALRN